LSSLVCSVFLVMFPEYIPMSYELSHTWFDVCWCYGVVRLGWCGILMQAAALLVCPCGMWGLGVNGRLE
jgi:hypothetical protein